MLLPTHLPVFSSRIAISRSSLFTCMFCSMFITASARSPLNFSAYNTINQCIKVVATTQKENISVNKLHTSQFDVIAGTVQSFGSYLVQHSKLGNYLRHKGGNVGGGGATPAL